MGYSTVRPVCLSVCPVCLDGCLHLQLGCWVSSAVFVCLDATGPPASLFPSLDVSVDRPSACLPVYIGAFYIAGRKGGWWWMGEGGGSWELGVRMGKGRVDGLWIGMMG